MFKNDFVNGPLMVKMAKNIVPPATKACCSSKKKPKCPSSLAWIAHYPQELVEVVT